MTWLVEYLEFDGIPNIPKEQGVIPGSPLCSAKLATDPLDLCAHNAFYVQLPISHGKTATPSGSGLLYRVLGRFDTQDRAFTA